jgi:hypothetical protein
MEKIKKWFPLSFKINGNLGKLILCLALYGVINIVAAYVISLVLDPITSIILVPALIAYFVLFFVGILLCATGIGIIIGLPMIFLGMGILFVVSYLVSAIVSIVNFIALAYIIAGSVVAIFEYCGLFGEISKAKKDAEEVKTEE